MTRTAPAEMLTLKSLLKNSASQGALGFVFAPKVFAVRLETHYGVSRESDISAVAPSLITPFRFLAWMQMWLRLVLGLETVRQPRVGAYAATLVSHREVRPERLDKPAAHNLEALMRFAPDGAGQGLTLNQYRERFTRLSVLGRVKLYAALRGSYVFWCGSVLRKPSGAGLLNPAKPALCHAPLRPD